MAGFCGTSCCSSDSFSFSLSLSLSLSVGRACVDVTSPVNFEILITNGFYKIPLIIKYAEKFSQ